MTNADDKLYEAIKSAVEYAFSVVGVEGFKKTSLFLSNQNSTTHH